MLGVGTRQTADGLGAVMGAVGQAGQRDRNQRGGEMPFPRSRRGAAVELLGRQTPSTAGNTGAAWMSGDEQPWATHEQELFVANDLKTRLWAHRAPGRTVGTWFRRSSPAGTRLRCLLGRSRAVQAFVRRPALQTELPSASAAASAARCSPRGSDRPAAGTEGTWGGGPTAALPACCSGAGTAGTQPGE